MKRLPFTFENLGPTDRPAQIEAELRAQANDLRRDPDRRQPKVIGVCEAIGKRLPHLARYGAPIRDTSPPGRANLALYVLDRLESDWSWIDLHETWPRTEHPGTHPPRSLLVAQVDDWRVIVGHAPPLGRGTADARNEWLTAIGAQIHAVSGPVLALTDPNGLAARLLRPNVVTSGSPVEAAHGKGVILDAHTVEVLNGVPMRTDHRRCLVGTARKRPT